ncbi:MAG TPA: urease accessory protein UreD [Alphaproteobacteria bacterium]
MPFDPQSGRSIALERGDGVAELVFAAPGPGSGLAHLFQTDPCRVLFPRAERGHPPTAVLLTTSGGLTGGDRLRIRLRAEAGAAATVTSQAAEKIYRSLEGDCRIDVAVEVGRAWLEWLPQETILFDRARLRRRTEVAVAAGGRFLGCEMLVFGRSARGESFTTGLLYDGWRIRSHGRLVWADALRLDGDVGRTLAGRAAFDDARAVASVIYVGDDAATHLDMARDVLASAGCAAATTVVNGILLARFIGRDAATVRHEMCRYLCAVRQTAGGWPPVLPRVWYQ